MTNSENNELFAFINNFISKTHKEQYLKHFGQDRKQGNVIAGMSNLTCLDSNYCTKLPNASKSKDIEFIKNSIKYKITSELCKVFSEFRLTNGKIFTIDKALDLVLTSGGTAIIVFTPNTVAYYEGESIGERYICIR